MRVLPMSAETKVFCFVVSRAQIASADDAKASRP
jgi:hypothetical protein